MSIDKRMIEEFLPEGVYPYFIAIYEPAAIIARQAPIAPQTISGRIREALIMEGLKGRLGISIVSENKYPLSHSCPESSRR